MRRKIAENILRASFLSKEGHIASALSVLDVMLVLFFGNDGENRKMLREDEFVLSKGHASLALYGILLEKKEITEEEFYSFCQKGSKLGGHPSSKKIRQVLISTGSLGHGLPFCVGLAMAKKIQNEKGTVYCLIGDGEANEGTTWESALAAANYGLDNLVCLMDYNKSGERAIRLSSPAQKFASFGWEANVCLDGNDPICIAESLSWSSPSRPKFLQIDTTKGYGCPVMENNPEWHHKCPSSEEHLEQLIRSIR